MSPLWLNCETEEMYDLGGIAVDVAGMRARTWKSLFVWYASKCLLIVYYANTDHGLLGCLYPYNEPVGLVSFMISTVGIWLNLILLDLQRWRCSFTFSNFRFFAHRDTPGVLASRGEWVNFKDSTSLPTME